MAYLCISWWAADPPVVQHLASTSESVSQILPVDPSVIYLPYNTHQLCQL